MHKGVKIVLNIVSGAALGVGGYFLGFKVGKKKTYDWAQGEINAILESKNEEITQLENEQLADLNTLTPDILEKLEYGKADEVVVETEVPVEPEDIKEEEVIIPKEEPKKAVRKKPKKTPYMIDDVEFDENSDDYDRVDLTIDENGDLYDDDSDELYETREYVGESMIKRMLKDIEFGDAKQWFVKNEAMNTVFDITYNHSR